MQEDSRGLNIRLSAKINDHVLREVRIDAREPAIRRMARQDVLNATSMVVLACVLGNYRTMLSQQEVLH